MDSRCYRSSMIFPFDVIFTTGYDALAIKAIRFSALDYLVKPIDKGEVTKTVAKVHNKNQHGRTPTGLIGKLDNKPTFAEDWTSHIGRFRTCVA